MDPLSDVLNLLHLRGAAPSRMEAGGRWALRFRAYPYVKVGAVLAGTCVLAPDGTDPLRLEAGDCYLLTGNRPYQVGSDPMPEPVDGHAVYAAARARAAGNSMTVRYGDPEAPDRTVLVGGSIEFDDVTAGLLLSSLPPTARIAADSPQALVLRPTLRLLADETAAERPGSAVMAASLTQILFLQALRAYLELAAEAGESGTGWLGGLSDPQIGAALGHMHRQPAHPWTVGELASAVGMSRSAFAQRFRSLVGRPPLDYLMRWRIQRAAAALRGGDRTVASVAAEWGYASESAFSNAFKRVTGQPPARHRALALRRPERGAATATG
ncbi:MULTISPECIES: AraC family transcriptional regulator [unclassified Streptomyces]|uniref:AraC family transcriptional regulator n=1 Tax=unclassified Streptomyces TaxID=2593676 RepID=UPI0038249A2D